MESEMQQSTAKLFATGGSQAVRLPAEFRFEGTNEVYIRRDESTGDVILSTRSPVDWSAFMQLREQLGPVPEDFLADREQGGQQRDPFEGWKE
jgi:antitoxin VapB